ncbi:HET-domain-containing protein [Xylariaceae sp. AK1471]|nr:HET-domain-containing protein [Xylariaceae sp. AK1471]
MRLINTQTFEFGEFYGTDIPKYAILSHTWQQGEEITFHEWQRWDADTSLQKKSGFKKILGASRQAQRDSLDWLWVDTNCIDKTSSAELTEAINSMYEWYSESVVCYAYLSDVSTSLELSDGQEFKRQFRESRWWTRGWTLQELLAPTRILFFTESWKLISDRESMAKEISDISGVSQEYLTGRRTTLNRAYAAEKMSWLSKRRTTRVEDMAYCMLGLFEVNLPLLYGEGRKAFIRLQEEIIRVSNDHTIFCWTWTDTVPKDWVSMLAPWPDTFAESQGYRPLLNGIKFRPYSMTNLGLAIQLPVIFTMSYWFVFLNVIYAGERPDATPRMCACVPLKEISASYGLRRSQFPARPILLFRGSSNTNDDSFTERFHDLIITSRIRGDLPLRKNHFLQKYGILLFISPTVKGPHGNRHRPIFIEDVLGQCPWMIKTEPKSSGFDIERSILGLEPLEDNAYSALLYFDYQNNPIYLFFAVTNVAMENESWHCGVALFDELENLLAPYLNYHENIESRVKECGKIWFQQMLRNAIEGSDCKSLYKTLDGSLTLGVGGRPRLDLGADVRAAYLSSSESFVFPINPYGDKKPRDINDENSVRVSPGEDNLHLIHSVEE